MIEKEKKQIELNPKICLKMEYLIMGWLVRVNKTLIVLTAELQNSCTERFIKNVHACMCGVYKNPQAHSGVPANLHTTTHAMAHAHTHAHVAQVFEFGEFSLAACYCCWR